MLDIDANTIILGFAAVMNVATAVITLRTHNATMATQIDVATVKKATDGMKDALVKATGEAAHASGVDQGRGEAVAVAFEAKKND